MGVKLLVTGACGFAGKSIIEGVLSSGEGYEVLALDNLSRPGSELNRGALRALGVSLLHADIRSASDIASLPAADWVIEAAGNPSVLAGVSGGVSSLQLCESNLVGSLHMLEYCRRHGAGFILLSSSRVYSVNALRGLPLLDGPSRFDLDAAIPLPAGLSLRGIDPDFSTSFPISLYGATKLSSEIVALEYGDAFDLPVWINRCGVLAGAGQFGRGDQGILTFWINAHLRRHPLRYLGFDGSGRQVRDALHPLDLARLILAQIASARKGGRRVYTCGGGPDNSISLAELTAWCDERFGAFVPARDASPRAYDVPWVVMDSSLAERDFRWRIERRLPELLEEIADHGRAHPDWLEISEAA